jgi:hypothetical protein
MLVELRKEVDERRLAPWRERVVFAMLARVLAHPPLYRLAVRIVRAAQRALLREGRARRLPAFLGEWTRTRDLPVAAARSFQERWAALERDGR